MKFFSLKNVLMLKEHFKKFYVCKQEEQAQSISKIKLPNRAARHNKREKKAIAKKGRKYCSIIESNIDALPD